MNEHVARLDASLARSGETVRLQRMHLAPDNEQIAFECTCRAVVRHYQPHELAGGIIQGDSKVILSASDIERAKWPGAQPLPVTGDKRVPRKGDRVVTQDRARAVQAATPFYVGGELVRIELQVRG